MDKLSIRHAFALGTTLIAGGALALPLVSQASTAGASTTTTTTTTTPKAPKAPKPLPPTAYSGYVEHITSSTAVLKGKVNPRGQATEYYFQYGPTTAYGAQTPPASVGSGTTGVAVTQAVAGLAPYSTYHFRVIANSSAGTVMGRDATFATKKVPLSITATASPSPVVFGSPLGISGTVSGTDNAGAQVVVQANAFPYEHGFHAITSPETTSATGSFAFPIAGLLESTQLRVATLTRPLAYSQVLTELVTVRITLHVRPTKRPGFVHLFGTVTPSEPGAAVAFERRVGHRYVTVAGTRIRRRSASRFARTIRLHHRGFYRALILVPGGAQVSGRSRPVLIG